VVKTCSARYNNKIVAFTVKFVHGNYGAILSMSVSAYGLYTRILVYIPVQHNEIEFHY
jgi:hypothetical protein